MRSRALRWTLQAFSAVLAVLLVSLPAPARNDGALREITIAALPPEARATLVLIRKGGPYPYDRDGVVFGNRERLLPVRERGYYREYTVPTPGLRHRGARRIVAGGATHYYTDDHYRSFKRIRE